MAAPGAPQPQLEPVRDTAAAGTPAPAKECGKAKFHSTPFFTASKRVSAWARWKLFFEESKEFCPRNGGERWEKGLNTCLQITKQDLLPGTHRKKQVLIPLELCLANYLHNLGNKKIASEF
ncbi:uncharacterized protein AAG666_015639 isoform 3-T6 [Megaptera novaeangliae]